MNHYRSPTVGAEHASAKPKRPKRRAFWFCRCVFRSIGTRASLAPTTPTRVVLDNENTNTCSTPLFSACSARRKHNRLAVGWLPYVVGNADNCRDAANLCGIMRRVVI
ncbi:MAG: hypothetical protein LBQ66_04980 [Planctomycetaceae bacterium]|nr:hypothetical protein [Planctomycetaceae bacterium]